MVLKNLVINGFVDILSLSEVKRILADIVGY